jgi:S-adenosylmethionine hydrolase
MECRCAPLSLAAILFLVAALSAGCDRRDAPEGLSQSRESRPAIVFMTDFGTANDAVAICKAVILRVVPDVRIMDITHQVTPFSIEEGARFLAGVTPYYPRGTIFLVVVDPGVGTSRKAVVMKSKRGQFFVLPDNGLITPVADRDGVEGVREITNSNWMVGDKVSSTFHGRDIFAPTAAHLAAGEDWRLVGPAVEDLVRLRVSVAIADARGISGEVIGLDDPYGSLITNIGDQDFRMLGYALGEKVTVRIGNKAYAFPYARTFMDVPVGGPLLYIDSRGRLGVALNQRDFSKTYKIAPPATVFIPRKGTSRQDSITVEENRLRFSAIGSQSPLAGSGRINDTMSRLPLLVSELAQPQAEHCILSCERVDITG